MKTISYNTANEFRVAIVIGLFTVAIFATVKVKDLQLKQTNNSEEMRVDRIEFIHNTIPILPYADAKLIEEPATVTGSLTAQGLSKSEQELASQLKTWVNNKSYWNEEESGNEKALTHQMNSWLKNGTYFSDQDLNEVPAVNGENQKNISINAKSVSITPEKDLAAQMKSWITSGDYWSLATR